MADLSEIQVGGKLRLEVVVTAKNEQGLWARVPTESQNTVWLSPREVSVAEYIPPPKPAFKRGDWVKHSTIGRGGLLLWVIPKKEEAVVHFWSCGLQLVATTNLEPDEAPNV